MGLRIWLFGPSVKDILNRPIGEGWPTRAELRAGAPSIFVDHTKDGGYETVYAVWEQYRESLASQLPCRKGGEIAR